MMARYIHICNIASLMWRYEGLSRDFLTNKNLKLSYMHRKLLITFLLSNLATYYFYANNTLSHLSLVSLFSAWMNSNDMEFSSDVTFVWRELDVFSYVDYIVSMYGSSRNSKISESTPFFDGKSALFEAV